MRDNMLGNLTAVDLKRHIDVLRLAETAYMLGECMCLFASEM